MGNLRLQFNFSDDCIKKLKTLFFNNEVFLYSKKCDSKLLNSFMQVISKSINSANNFDFENNLGSDSNIKQLFADYCNIVDCSKFIINFFEVSGNLKKTEYFKSYYEYNNWKKGYNNSFEKEIIGNKIKKINCTEYTDKDYFEYLRCLLLAHPLDCSLHIPTRDVIRIEEKEGKIIDKSELHYLLFSSIEKNNEEYEISVKVLSTTKDYIPKFNIKLNDIFNYVNYYYSSLKLVINKCEKRINKIMNSWNKVQCDLNLSISDSILELIELSMKSNFKRFESYLNKLKKLYSFARKYNNEISNNYLKLLEEKYEFLKKEFNKHNLDGFYNIIDSLVEPNFDEVLHFYYCDVIAKNGAVDYSVNRLFNVLKIKQYKEEIEDLDDQLSLIEITAILNRTEVKND